MWFLQILVPVIAFVGAFIVQCYANFTGKLPSKGNYLGFSYDSAIIRALVTQFEYIWILIFLNFLLTLMFQLGFRAFANNFLTLAVVWLSMGPVAALVFNSAVLKEKVTPVALIGIFFLVMGSIMVVAQKEVAAFFK